MSDQLEGVLKQLKYFMADASHELKTPLTVVKGIVEGLIDGIYDRNDNDNYLKIINEINDMNCMVYDLLEISKIESSQIEFSTGIFLFSDLILDIHDKLQPLVSKKNIEVSLNLSEFFIEGDEERIKRAVRNLYINAIRYTSENGSIDIEVSNFEKSGYFEMKNSPAYISDEDIKNIWKPFYISEKSRNKKLGGSGLGLYMVKEILDKHDFSYGIENYKDGVLAYFKFPVFENFEDDEIEKI